MRTVNAAAFTALLVLGLTAPVAGQERGVRVTRFVGPAPLLLKANVDPVVQVEQPEQTDALSLTMAGALGAAIGAIAGAYAGYQLDYNVLHLDCSAGCEDPGLIGLIAGWSVGPALTTPLAVHLLNGRRGSLSRAYLYSGLIAGAGIMALGLDAPAVAVLGPLAQTISAVVVERTTSP